MQGKHTHYQDNNTQNLNGIGNIAQTSLLQSNNQNEHMDCSQILPINKHTTSSMTAAVSCHAATCKANTYTATVRTCCPVECSSSFTTIAPRCPCKPRPHTVVPMQTKRTKPKQVVNPNPYEYTSYTFISTATTLLTDMLMHDTAISFMPERNSCSAQICTNIPCYITTCSIIMNDIPTHP